jgi:hypothetical protein
MKWESEREGGGGMKAEVEMKNQIMGKKKKKKTNQKYDFLLELVKWSCKKFMIKRWGIKACVNLLN